MGLDFKNIVEFCISTSDKSIYFGYSFEISNQYWALFYNNKIFCIEIIKVLTVFLDSYFYIQLRKLKL